MQLPDDFLRRAIDHRAQLRGAGKERAGFHSDDPEIFFAREMQIEAALRLDHFPGANFRRGPRDRAADPRVVEIGREIQRVRKKHVAEEDAERIAPARVHRRLRAAAFRVVHDVVVHQRREVNQFHDDREIDMLRR